MELKQGTLLHGGAYRIEQVLGQGSFGITYLAVHTALDKKVAIKEFFMKEINGRGDDGSIMGMSDGSLSMNYARKFQKEALNLSRLEHPNIVRVTDSFEDNGTFYYVMDYIEGENLNDYVKHNYISRQEAVDIIRDVAKALMYMHEEKHMLHLDLKPGNIMRRSSDGHIFLIDFGLSKHYSSNGQPETSTTIGLGTAGYAPIEQANQAKSGEFRPTIDVYALGATFYKLLTRETPPAASELVSDNELLANNLKQHNINSKLSSVVVNAMLPSVRMRTQSVKEFLASLDSKKKDATIDTPTSSKHNATNTTSDDTIQQQSNKDEDTVLEELPKLSVGKDILRFEAEGNRDWQYVSVDTNQEWKVYKKAQWVEITKFNSGFRVRVDENSGQCERESQIKITAGSLVRTINIVQRPQLYVGKSILRFDAEGNGDLPYVYVDTNQEWKVSCLSQWIEIKKLNSSFSVYVGKNSGQCERRCQIKVIAGSLVKTIDIVQKGKRMENDNSKGNGCMTEIYYFFITIIICGFIRQLYLWISHFFTNFL